MPRRKDEGMFIFDMWIWVPTSRSTNRKLLQFCTAEISLHCEELVCQCPDPADRQVAGCKDIMSHDEDIFTLNVDGEALEEEIECELEDETVQDAERLRTVSSVAILAQAILAQASCCLCSTSLGLVSV